MYKTDYLKIHENQYKKVRNTDRIGWSDEESLRVENIYFNYIFQLYQIPENGKILELGCGDGGHALLLAKQGFDVYGIDISPTAVDWAKEKANNQKLQADFTVGSVVELPYENNFFDVVIDNCCGHCIIQDDRKLFLSETYRVLKKGGKFLMLTLAGEQNFDGEMKKMFDPATRCLVKDGVAGRYVGLPEDILGEIETAGFRIDKWEIERIQRQNDGEFMRIVAGK